ncbi:DUF3558 family protein [Streptomyces sp. NBC_00872]|uniref:DUF3558 family protein n=1 Tax=Streptomyces sp. NBC_00872 TaxID=2903686 RepID=UPI003864B093|nr:DUF3558 domain-containing protein [Streptomyces sp. NBC_00872]
MKRSSLAVACLVFLLVPTLAACGSDTDTDTATRAPGDSSPAASAPEEPDGAAPAEKKVDACTLFRPAEVTPVIGRNDGGRPDAGVGESVCRWENPETYHSITLSIGSPGTAVPDQSASGSDGITFGSGNLAEFVVGDRACTLQVVTSVTDESDRPTAEKLIGLVRTRL